MKLIISLVLLIAAPWLSAQEIPDFSANYLVKINGLQAGELKRKLSSNEDGSRTFKSSTKAKGIFAFFKPDLVEETSVWQKINGTIRPELYIYQRSGGKKDKVLTLDFNWSKNLIQIAKQKQTWTVKLKQKTQDKLVYQLSLMSDLTDANIETQTRFSYLIADSGKLKTYDIDIVGKEVITTPLGKIETIKLTRHRNNSKNRQTTLWCAPTLNYLPVKLEHIEKDGAVFTAILRRLKGFDSSDVFNALTSNDSGIILP